MTNIKCLTEDEEKILAGLVNHCTTVNVFSERDSVCVSGRHTDHSNNNICVTFCRGLHTLTWRGRQVSVNQIKSHSSSVCLNGRSVRCSSCLCSFRLCSNTPAPQMNSNNRLTNFPSRVRKFPFHQTAKCTTPQSNVEVLSSCLYWN